MSTKPAKGGRKVVCALLALCLAPPLLAMVLLYFAPPGIMGDSSHGTLIDSTDALPDIALGDPRGQVHGHLHGKWSLLYLGAPHCADPCQGELHRMRAAWLSLGSRAQRVQRIYILPAGAPAGRELMELLRGLPGHLLWRLPAANPRITSLFQDATLVLLDPNGLPVIRYPADIRPVDIARDLKRLLRASRIG